MDEKRFEWLVENVTLEEAKELVRRLSNTMSMTPDNRKLLPCAKCGRTYTRQWHSVKNPPQYIRTCGTCLFKGYPASSPGAAKIEWNHAVKDMTAGVYEMPYLGPDWRKG